MYVSGPTNRLALARDSLLVANCLCSCESDEKHDHTQKSIQSPHSLNTQFATGRGQMVQQRGIDSTASILTTLPENLQLESTVGSAFYLHSGGLQHAWSIFPH